MDKIETSVSDVKSEARAKYDVIYMPTLVSFTGADDRTNLTGLQALSQQYPNIEWGLLYYPEKQGYARNPTDSWIQQFVSCVFPHTAIHLCGTSVFEQLLNPIASTHVLDLIGQFHRVQLNINARRREFTTEQVHQIYDVIANSNTNVEMILQIHDDTVSDIESWLEKRSCEWAAWSIDKSTPPPNRRAVSGLVDKSRGRGQTPSSWEFNGFAGRMNVGFAGGINPWNCLDVVKAISATPQGQISTYWIDMESGVRSDNDLFDLNKVGVVADIVARRQYP